MSAVYLSLAVLVSCVVLSVSSPARDGVNEKKLSCEFPSMGEKLQAIRCSNGVSKQSNPDCQGYDFGDLCETTLIRGSLEYCGFSGEIQECFCFIEAFCALSHCNLTATGDCTCDDGVPEECFPTFSPAPAPSPTPTGVLQQPMPTPSASASDGSDVIDSPIQNQGNQTNHTQHEGEFSETGSTVTGGSMQTTLDSDHTGHTSHAGHARSMGMSAGGSDHTMTNTRHTHTTPEHDERSTGMGSKAFERLPTEVEEMSEG